MGGPPKLASRFRTLALPDVVVMILERSRVSRILGFMPAYSSAKTGVSAAMMASAERASAPTASCQMWL